jgi:hypothetical protein
MHVSRRPAGEKDRSPNDLLHRSCDDIIWNLLIILLQVNFEFGAVPSEVLVHTACLIAVHFSQFFVICLSQGIVGIGIGLSYSSPIVNGFKYFKKSKGIVTGVITTG